MFFFFNDTATTEIYTLSLHDALPISMIPNASAGTELLIIASAILGGTALSGGGGTIQGTLLGVLIFGTLRNGLVINNVNAYWQQIASGIALVIAVAIDRLRTGGYR